MEYGIRIVEKSVLTLWGAIIIRAHEFTKDTITKNPSAQITQTLLTKLKAKGGAGINIKGSVAKNRKPLL